MGRFPAWQGPAKLRGQVGVFQIGKKAEHTDSSTKRPRVYRACFYDVGCGETPDPVAGAHDNVAAVGALGARALLVLRSIQGVDLCRGPAAASQRR